VNTPASRLSLIRGALIGILSAVAAGQQSAQEYNLRVNGAPVVSTRPAIRVGREWFVPLAPIARALGATISLDATAQSLRVLRSNGLAATYDGPTGRILQGSVQAGTVENFRQVQLNVGIENVMFPLNGAVALFGVTAREDREQQVIEIEALSASGGGAGGGGPFFQLASLEDRYGLTTNGAISQQFLNLHGDALLGTSRLIGSLDLTRVVKGSFVEFRQGSLRLETSNQRAITLGDQGTYTGVEALMNSVRGLGYEWRWRGYQVDVYGGRAASSTSAGLGTSGIANYDTTLAGFGLHRRVRTSEFSLGGNWFHGPRRSGTTFGAAYSGIYASNEFRLQGLVGYFAGFSLRPVLQVVSTSPATEPVAPVAPGGIVQVEQETQYVKGAGYGFSVVDSYKPFKSNLLLFTGLWEDYSRNFLIAREESRFSAVSRKSFSASLRPSRYIGFLGSVRQDTELLGNGGGQRGYTYGVNATLPGSIPVQGGYFHSVQENGGPLGSKFQLNQYSLQVPRWNRFALSAIYSEVHFGSLLARSLTETLSADLKRYGRVTIHDQLQLKSGHNYGFDWSREFGHSGSYLLGGLERQTSLQRAPILAPVASLRLPIFHGQVLTMSYLSVGGSSIFRVEIGGPVIRKREQVTANSQTALVVMSSLTGQVYFDADLDGTFKAGVDRPIPHLEVVLDGEIRTTTDAAGYFHFDGISPGSHRLTAKVATLPANLIFAQEELHVAVMPYRANQQDFRAIRTGKIQGTVVIVTLDDLGREMVKPFPDARILATSNKDSFSENDGSYVFGDLPPGVYQVRLDPATTPASFVSRPAVQTVEVKSGATATAPEFRLMRPVVVRSAPAPTRGAVEGLVSEVRAGVRAPAPGVVVQLDQSRTTITGADGRFRFADVTGGNHHIQIVPDRLPVEFDLGPANAADVAVNPGKAATVEFSVVMTALLGGQVSGPAGIPLNGILVRLAGTDRQTTTDSAGGFRIAKLRDGEYTVLLDEKTLPENTVMTNKAEVTISVRAGQESPPIEFHFGVRKPKQPDPAKPPAARDEVPR
jgi:hypothetical protein